MNPNEIIKRFYNPGTPLYETLMTHSEAVARKALVTIEASGLKADRDFIYEAAMLHDIGIFRTDAPSIHCLGSLPYICHGIEGRRLLDEAGFPIHALVCERHTGAGLTIEDIQKQSLPLPLRDMTPQSVEEKVICYADKFYSKSGILSQEKPLDRVIASMAAHGPDSLNRFMDLHHLFNQ